MHTKVRPTLLLAALVCAVAWPGAAVRSDAPALVNGKLTVAPAGATYKMPEPSGIVTGPDGALWIAEGSRITRMTTTGAMRHFATPSGDSADTIAVGPGGTVWYADELADVIGTLSTSGASLIFKLKSGSHVRAMALGPDGAMWLAESGAGAVARMTLTGAFVLIGTWPTGFQPEGITAGPDGRLWISDAGNDAIVALSLDGHTHAYPTPTRKSHPGAIIAGKDGNLWFAETNTDRIGRLTPTGSFTEYPLNSSGGRDPKFNPWPDGLAWGADGSVWFTEQSNDMVRRLSSSGAIKDFTTKTAEATPTGITTGPDGNLWFTENAAAQVGVITLAGAMTEFPLMSDKPPVYEPAVIAPAAHGGLWLIPGGDTPSIGLLSGTGEFRELTRQASASWLTSRAPSWMTSSADGSAWLVESSKDKIGKLSVEGVLTEYAVPNTQLTGIAAAPDGSVWLADSKSNKILKMTFPGPAIAPYTIPTLNSGPLYITTDASGNAWFSEFDGNKIGRVTPKGDVVEFKIPRAYSQPGQIAIAPNGVVWFAEMNGGGKLGSIQPDGTVRELDVPQTFQGGIACVAADGSGFVWFGVEAYPHSYIGRVSPAGKLERFTIPTPESYARSCALSTDGIFWFSELAQRVNAGSLGSVTPAGVLTEYSIR